MANGGEDDDFTVICSWCSRLLHLGKGPISHGICEACQKAYFPNQVPAPEPPKKCEECGVKLNADLTCPECGVAHSEQCSKCLRWGFHLNTCPEVTCACGHPHHSAYDCDHHDEDGVPCDCAGAEAVTNG